MAQHPEELLQWADEVSTHLAHLSKPVRWVLALYSFGMVVVGQCGRTTIAFFLGQVLGQSTETVERRLRESVCDAQDKKGDQRCAMDVGTCFAPLLRWVISRWDDQERRLAVALDASNLGQRFTVLSISVMYRGCALPVAWAVLPATAKGAWMPHWKRLLRALRGVVPEEWTVIVLTDRGLYSKTLYEAIRRNQWHPLMRINAQGKFRQVGTDHFRLLRRLVPCPRTVWRGEVECFVTRGARLRCTLLTRWDEGYETPWLLVTDLAPHQADSLWYGLRGWIEQGFKDCKRGGFQWQHTLMTDPARATRLWLVMALASLWQLSVVDPGERSSSLSGFDILPPHERDRPVPRLSRFKRGWLITLASFLRRKPIVFGSFCPDPWPVSRFSPAILALICQGDYCVYY